MNDSSSSGVVVVTLGLILILLLVLGGVGFYYVTERQQATLAAAAEKARAEEARARDLAEKARAERTHAIALRERPNGQESAVIDGDTIRTVVELVLRAQEEAWNRGDLAGFMVHYWQSDDLTFISDGRIIHGWNNALKSYQDRYRTPETMGRLTLNGLEITPLGDSAALAVGQFHVQRESEPRSGNFSLVFRKFADRWLIIHDHTSQLMESQQEAVP